MTLQNWGEMQKSLIDNETIEEAIDRLIGAHNDESDAHLGIGQSLNAHKSDDVIDHPAFSVVTDKVPDGGLSYRWFPIDRYTVMSNMGEDSWAPYSTGNGNWEQYPGELQLRSGDSTGDQTGAGSDSGRQNLNTFDEDWFWQTTLSLDDSSDVLVTYGFCNSDVQSGNNNGVFFEFEDGTLYAGYQESGNTKVRTSITAPSTGDLVLHTYRIDYISADDEIHWYIDGVLEHTLTPPSPAPLTASRAGFDIVSKANAKKTFTVTEFFLDIPQP